MTARRRKPRKLSLSVTVRGAHPWLSGAVMLRITFVP